MRMKKRIYLYHSLVANHYHALSRQCSRACHSQEILHILLSYSFQQAYCVKNPANINEL